MRIRKASKILLGYSSPPQRPHSPSPPPPISVDDACHLNQSPWDLPLSEQTQYLITPTFEEEEEDGGIVGSSIAEEAAIRATLKSTASIANGEEEDVMIKSEIDRDQKKRKRKKKKVEKKVADGSAGVSYGICKKTDGKSWRCKKPVHPPHSLCSHHLAQLRSYTTSTTPAVRSYSKSHRRNPTTKSVKAENGDSGFYYYSGFGPGCAKRRRDYGGGGAGDGGDNVSIAAEEGGNGSNSDEDDVIGSENNNNNSAAGEEESKDDKNKEGELRGWKSSSVLRKRRRKPIKARSLKSLI